MTYQPQWHLGWSLMGITYGNYYLTPEVRRQTTTNDCSHCALCPSIEMRNQMSWIHSASYEYYKFSRVDLEWLKGACPPPQYPNLMIQNIVRNYQGVIQPWPLYVKGCTSYDVTRNAPARDRDLNDALTHLMYGPIIGSFRVCTNYTKITYPDLLYVGNGDYVPLNSVLYPGLALTHAVCIVGVLPLQRGSERTFAFQVLEAGPVHENVRMRYIRSDDMDYLYIPHCA